MAIDPITGGLIASAGGALISGLFGSRSAKKARKQQQQAINAQQSWEAANAARAQEQMALADHLLYGGMAPQGPWQQQQDAERKRLFERSIAHLPPEEQQRMIQEQATRPMDQRYLGAPAGASGMMVAPDGSMIQPGQQQGSPGALGQAEGWTSDYLNWLRNSPDLTYNAQRGRMEGDIRQSMQAAAQALGRRGLTGKVQSGVAGRDMADISMGRAGMLGQLEAGRFDRQGERLGMGTQLTQGLVDRALNMRSAATGQAMGQQTMIPGMHMQQAAGHAGQANAWGQFGGALMDYGLQARQPRVQMPTTAPLPGNQWHDYMTPGKMGGAWGGMVGRAFGY